MAELAASAFAALTTTGTAAAAGSGAAAATAATAAGTVATAGSGLLSGLQGAATIASMVASIYGGAAAYRSGKDQAMFANLDAETARIEGEAKALEIRREMVKRVGDTRVAFAASGLDISSGADVEGALTDEADFQIANAQGTASMTRSGQLAKAAAERSKGEASLVTSLAKAGQYGADYQLDLRKRK